MPPRTVGPYEILTIVGRGGVGTVYRARHRDTGLPVAVKLLAPPPACDPVAARRLAREFEALQDLRHPNVVRVHEVGVHEGYSYLAMELVEGLDLRSYLSPAVDESAEPAVRAAVPRERSPREGSRWSDEPDTGDELEAEDEGLFRRGPDAIRAFAALMDEPETDPGPLAGAGAARERERAGSSLADARALPPGFLQRLNRQERVARLVDALVQVCEALAYVHARGLVHRDLKPSNIMVDDARRVRLMDFGLVKLASDGDHPAHPGKVVGTYRYMSPEQARGEDVDARADLYSLGVVLFELLCGRPPFTARRAAELWNEIVSRPPPRAQSVNPGADPCLAFVAERLMAKDPAARYPRAEDVAAAVRRSAGAHGAARPPW